MALADYEALATRSFDELCDPDLRAQILVCGDDLSQSGDPRGPLITMEHALHDAPDPRRALELRRAIHEHAAEHCVDLLGGIAPLMKAKRGLALEWRSGKVYGAFIDARYMPDQAKLSAGELIKLLLKAPAAADLRRLRVRVRNDDAIKSIVAMLRKRKHPTPLEELEISGRSWPVQIADDDAPNDDRELRDGLVGDNGKYTLLHYLVLGDSLMAAVSGDVPDPEVLVTDVLLADPPTSLLSRIVLGRALTSANDALRNAALARIGSLGPVASCFARTLTVLLQPKFPVPQVPVVAALRALGPSHAHSLFLAQIASNAPGYDADTRRAAGIAAAEVRPR